MQKKDILAAIDAGEQFLVLQGALHGSYIHADLSPINESVPYPVFLPNKYGTTGAWWHVPTYLVDAVEPSDNGWTVHYSIKGGEKRQKLGVISRHIKNTVSGTLAEFLQHEEIEDMPDYVRLCLRVLSDKEKED